MGAGLTGVCVTFDSNISDSNNSAQKQLHLQHKHVSTVLFNRPGLAKNGETFLQYNYKEDFFFYVGDVSKNKRGDFTVLF